MQGEREYRRVIFQFSSAKRWSVLRFQRNSLADRRLSSFSGERRWSSDTIKSAFSGSLAQFSSSVAFYLPLQQMPATISSPRSSPGLFRTPITLLARYGCRLLPRNSSLDYQILLITIKVPPVAILLHDAELPPVARLLPVVGLLSDYYPMPNFLLSSDFYPMLNFLRPMSLTMVFLSSITDELPLKQR
ncbi:hypothetical protein M5K25_020299 [Dendrobium thyrsiflorum]|uniref:Uncharacterized protein n=1 Tax=Dendrobium thyrsiflorum TaxID=117978 RepID=A0ABD0U9N3_DENTH